MLNCKNLGEYNDHYLKIDVLLLADIFENFWDTCFAIYKIDPAHCYSAPSLSYNPMLKTIKRPLPLLTDYDMYMFVESGIRGGYCNVSKRHVKANNRYMGDDFDSTQPEKYLLYLDANNLYGHSMSEALPYGDYQWMSEWEFVSFEQCISRIPANDNKGYIVEVDLEIPPKLHSKFEDFTICPERLRTSNKKNVPPKLIATLHKKEHYVTHYRYLQVLLKNGFKLTKIHRGISFFQTPWLKQYIDLNTERRKAAKSEFEKNFFKLMNNSVYGKMLENARDFHLVYKPHLIQRWINKPNFILNSKTNLMLIEMARTKIKFDKNIIAGMTVLEVSKTVMVNFHFDVMKNIFPEPGDLILVYTDTDSFIYEIKTNNRDLYEILKENKEHFDFSDYPIDHPCFSNENKKKLGKFKDEANGRIMEEYVGLKSKMYAYKFHRHNEEDAIKKAKGVKSNIISTELTFENYLSVLNGEQIFVNQFNIQSKYHTIYTQCQRKLALSGLDDKRYITMNGIDTLP